MMRFIVLLSIAAAAVLADPVPKYRRQNDTTPASPCAQVSMSSAAAMRSNAIAVPTVSAQLAYDCLTSVPLHKEDATALVKAILPYVEWQSNLAYLKNPPAGYLQQAVDILGTFDTILSNIEASKYGNEHEFQADLFATFNLAKDGHFRFMPDLLSKAVSFSRPVSLVSVSANGIEIPKIYEKEAIVSFNFGQNDGSLDNLPSALTKINGEDATKFLESWAQLGALQDPDALYNNVFYEKAFDALQGGLWSGYFAGSGRFGLIYPGANTTLEFEDGTVKVLENYAQVEGNFSEVIDADSMYQRFCTGPHLQPYTSNITYPFPSPPPLPPTATYPVYGYPTPAIISSDGQVSGYLLDESDPAYADVAVLAMLSFQPSFPVEFQSVVETFITKARSAGKTKLVIDLSGNGGGTILVGYDTFRQLFPSIVQDGFSRFREHEAFDILSRELSLYSTKFDAATADNKQIFAYLSVPNYHYDLNETNQNFMTHDDKFAPQRYNGDAFTSIMRWNLSDPLTTTNTTWGVGETITGYSNRQNFTQPFEAMDIIMVYDGYCASTCTLFSEFMRLQAGVKSIAFGGKPNKDPIQAIGGTKGANNYPYNYIMTLASVPLSTASSEQIANWSALTAYTDLPMNRSSDSSLNVRDQILRPNLEDGIPAQFIYEEADCRVYYEPSMISDVQSIWKRAADVAWGGAKCVVGSLPSNETVTARRRRSEELKLKAKNDRRMPSNKRWLQRAAENALLTSPLHGQKVPL